MVDTSFQGVPLFGSLLDRITQSTTADVVIFINADIVLFQDFVKSLCKTMTLFDRFLFIAARYDLAMDTWSDWQFKHAVKSKSSLAIASYVNKHGTLHTYGGMDVWAWNRNNAMHSTSPSSSSFGYIPPFVFGRGRYDNWLTHETETGGERAVVDASETSLLVHVRHDYHLVSGGDVFERNVDDDWWSEGSTSKFEQFINAYLSLRSGSYVYQKGGILNASWKLSKCLDEDDFLCVLKRIRPGLCNCELSPFVRHTQSDPVLVKGTKLIRCGRVITESKLKYTVPFTVEDGIDLMRNATLDTDNGEDDASNEVTQPSFGLPHTLESLIDNYKTLRPPPPHDADTFTVILTAFNFSYRDMMMNFVCNLRRLRMYPSHNVLIAALDRRAYLYGYVRSLPIFLFDSTSGTSSPSYGSDEFRRLTKLKTKLVLQALRLGVNVLWSDVDIIYFRNPITDLWNTPGDIIIQSNAADGIQSNRRRRLNSGFYLAKHSPNVITTFMHIIKYAHDATDLSEQPCFYDVVCGQSAQFVVGTDRCVYAGKVTVRILDRAKYANGLTKSLWNFSTTHDERIGDSPMHRQLYMLHNNWIVGGDRKRERLRRHGFEFYNSLLDVCIYGLTEIKGV